MKILIIGGGNMGLTYAQSFLRSQVAKKENMTILEKSPEQVQLLAFKDVGTVCTNAADCIRQADLIIFAIKPQDAEVMFQNIKPYVNNEQVFLSVMAGIKIATITENLGIHKVIRAMPNLPAKIGKGITVFTTSKEVSRIELIMVQNLINTTGKTIHVEKESAIDAATAISGSGPAYVYFFMDSMIKAAKQMGFTPEQAEFLVLQTFKGSVDTYLKDNLTCAAWIEKVSSKGGTTEAAMRSFGKNKVQDNIIEGCEKALDKAVELGKANANPPGQGSSDTNL